MVCPDNQLIGGENNQVKPKAQERQKVFNLAVPKRTEAALVEIFIFQYCNLILLWLYPLSTAVSFFIIYLSNSTHGRPGGQNSGGPVGY